MGPPASWPHALAALRDGQGTCDNPSQTAVSLALFLLVSLKTAGSLSPLYTFMCTGRPQLYFYLSIPFAHTHLMSIHTPTLSALPSAATPVLSVTYKHITNLSCIDFWHIKTIKNCILFFPLYTRIELPWNRVDQSTLFCFFDRCAPNLEDCRGVGHAGRIQVWPSALIFEMWPRVLP
ncbi:hypothetical protein EDB85DRAFT_1603840 [Lactarius pseudohatsudake]|nr:hypothetical protein EDB85DRAFT_1603840 [Lactarius pseudohatsudake]